MNKTSAREQPRFYARYPEVIFISHDASLTGAPILILTLMEWWRHNGGPRFRVILRNGGRLEARFRKLGQVLNLGWSGTRVHASETERRLLRSFCGPDLRLIYANTGAVGDVLEALDPISVPVITHVHELETMLAVGIGPERFQLSKERTERYVVPARAVGRNLVTNHSVAPGRITIVPEYLADDYHGESSPESQPLMTILGAGTTDWRKGPDLFIELAAGVLARLRTGTIRLVWVGGQTEAGQIDRLRHQAQQRGVGQHIEFVGEQTDLRPFYRKAALFVSTSREDPYPVVCLEAAAHGLPVLCFSNAGGMVDFVGDDAGCAVPDLDKMVAAICELLGDPTLRRRTGNIARQRIEQGHRVSVCGKRLLDLVLETMARSCPEKQ